jgi:hypothetical protein
MTPHHRPVPRHAAASAAVAGGPLTLVAVLALRRAVLRWGATDGEVDSPLPGDDVVVGGRTTTYAVTVGAPPESVWPWLVQIGRGRGGFSTYTWIENALRADIHTVDRIDVALQDLRAGDRVWMTPETYLGRLPGQFWQVRLLEPGHALVLERRPPQTPRWSTWALVVEPLSARETRLLDRHRWQVAPGVAGWLSDTFWSVGALLMERRMLLGIKQRAERAAR